MEAPGHVPSVPSVPSPKSSTDQVVRTDCNLVPRGTDKAMTAVDLNERLVS